MVLPLQRDDRTCHNACKTTKLLMNNLCLFQSLLIEVENETLKTKIEKTIIEIKNKLNTI